MIFRIDPTITEQSVRAAANVVGPYARATGMLRLKLVATEIQIEPKDGYDLPGVVQVFRWEQLWKGGLGEIWLPVPVACEGA